LRSLVRAISSRKAPMEHARFRLYFSFVTLATLGYGDYTPAGSLGRTLAIVEALFGQLYLVTVIAVLVSRMRRASPE